MKKLLLLLLLPGFGSVLIVGGLLWSWTELSVMCTGQRANAQVVAMVKARTNGADIIVGLNHLLTFTLQSGAVIEVGIQDNQPTAITVSNATGQFSLPAGVLAAEMPDPLLPGNFPVQVWEVVRGDVESIKRIVQREAKRPGGERIVQIRKMETARLWHLPNPLPEQWQMDGEVLALRGATSTAVTCAVFAPPVKDQGGTNRNSWLMAYERTVDGLVTEPFRQDFVQFDEPYTTEFRSVFRFTSGGMSYAGLSDMGRQGGPSPTFRLFEPCRVAYPPADPGRAILLPHYGAHDVRTSPLVWFSFASEGFFSRWVYLCLLTGTGLGLVIMGLVVVSLALKPSLRLLDDLAVNAESHNLPRQP